jgi:transketolase
MATRNSPSADPSVAELKVHAKSIRRHVLAMSRRIGQGYVAQGLAIADTLAAIYFHELRYDPANPQWAARDRFLLSTGHYSIALWATFAEAGIIPVAELETYGRDESRLEMSTLDSTPGVEIIGGSLGHGLGQAVGMALGQRLRKSEARIFVEFSDGELQEGSTWEALMSSGSFGLDNLVALIDCNGIQADGKIVIDIEPVAGKCRAFGWDVQEIDGNSMGAIVAALKNARAKNGKPKAIVLRTLPGKGVPTLEQREKAHFVRVEASEWDQFDRELEENNV